MKIYYKKNFISGVVCLLLGVLNPLTCLFVTGWDRFTWKDGWLSIALVLAGVQMLLRSLDPTAARKDLTEDLDERNRLIELRSQAASYRLLFRLILAGIVICMLGYGVSRQEAFVHALLPLLLLYLAAGIARLVTLLGYEQTT